jgi:hypothetical protein
MPKSFERCVSKVKASGKVDNAYAICQTSYKKTHGGRGVNTHTGKTSTKKGKK